jgi:hypothetical protein
VPSNAVLVLAGLAVFAVMNLTAAVVIRRRTLRRFGPESPEYRMRLAQDRLVVGFWFVAAPLVVVMALFWDRC